MSRWRDTFLALAPAVTPATPDDTWGRDPFGGCEMSQGVRGVNAAIVPEGAELRAAVLRLSSATPEQAADEAADRAASAAEPLLPAPGTAERTAMDLRHAAIIAGLLVGRCCPPETTAPGVRVARAVASAGIPARREEVKKRG